MSQMPVVVGYNGKKHANEALDWAAEEALHRAAALVVLFAANYPGMTLPEKPGLFEFEPGALDAATELTDIGVAEVRTARHSHREDSGDQSHGGTGGRVR